MEFQKSAPASLVDRKEGDSVELLAAGARRKELASQFAQLTVEKTACELIRWRSSRRSVTGLWLRTLNLLAEDVAGIDGLTDPTKDTKKQCVLGRVERRLAHEEKSTASDSMERWC